MFIFNLNSSYARRFLDLGANFVYSMKNIQFLN